MSFQRHPPPLTVQTIDQLLQHHYFQSKLQQIIARKHNHTDMYGLIDNQYYKAEDQLITDLTQIIQNCIQTKLKEVLSREFINIGDEIESMKGQMFIFMGQQTKKTQQLQKQFMKISEQMKRKVTTNQIMNNTGVISTGNYGTRFQRSSGTSTSIQSSNSLNAVNVNETKSYYSELASLRKQLENLKQSTQNGEFLKSFAEEFSSFKIQTKVGVESLKQTIKKITVEVNSMSKSTNTLNPAIKQSIDATVKRTIASQLKVYASYSEQLSQIKQLIELFDDKIQKQNENHMDYVANQLKSVWLIINDIKKVQDSITDEIGLRTSRILL